MAKEIPSELKTFKEKLNGKLSSISSGASQIVSKINDLVNVVNTTKSDVSANYQSSTDVNAAVTKLANTSEIMTVMSNDINSTVTGAVVKANSILEKVNKLESLISDIERQEAIISRESAKEEPDSGALSSARSKKAELEKEFDNVVKEAQTALSELKAMDKQVETSKASGAANGAGTNTGSDTSGTQAGSVLNTYTEYLQNLKYGTFTKQSYNSSVGKINYWIYVPDGAEKISGLPVMIYMHGGSGHGNGGNWISQGLGAKIQKREVTPQGIVICPLMTDFEGDAGKRCRRALIELTNATVQRYNCDKRRISVSGHSYGAITGYTLIKENPGYFAAFSPMSGWNDVNSDLKNVKVWAFHGDQDNRGGGSRTTYPGAVKAIQQINSIGGKAKLTTFKGMGHGNVQNKASVERFTSPDGRQETFLEWAFRQVRT